MPNLNRASGKTSRRTMGALLIVACAFALGNTACDPEALRKLAQAPEPIPPAQSPPRQNVGPRAWVEFPLAGQTLPMGPVPFVVYAADPQNIAQINLSVNGQALPAGQDKGLDAVGGHRLARLDQIWQPPAEGQYILEARARNSAGAYGQPAYTKFCVGSCKPTTPTPTVTASPTGMPTPAAIQPPPITPITPLLPSITIPPPTVVPPPPTPTTTVVPPPAPVTINFRADAPYVNAGACTTLRWDVDGVQAVYLDNQPVTGHGSQQVCPCQQTTYTLRVVKRDNSAETRQVTIGVYGTCAAPPAPPTTAVPPQPPPQDKTGPSLSNVGLRWENCKFIGTATITDPSSVPNAQFWYNHKGQGWQSVSMWPRGGGNWEADSGVSVMEGIGSPTGTIQYYVTATDGAGNQSKSGTSTKNYMGCGG